MSASNKVVLKYVGYGLLIAAGLYLLYRALQAVGDQFNLGFNSFGAWLRDIFNLDRIYDALFGAETPAPLPPGVPQRYTTPQGTSIDLKTTYTPGTDYADLIGKYR